MVTQERLKKLLNYDKDSGIFTWAKNRGRSSKGSVAGHLSYNGYVYIKIDGKNYSAHRLAWLYENAQLSDLQIDHINRIRNDNRISNLREVTPLENQQNHSKHKTNKSGIVGVHWCKRDQKWVAGISYKNKSITIGVFNTKEEAAEARTEAKAKYHTFHSEDNNDKAA